MKSVDIDENYVLYEDGRVYSKRNKKFLKQGESAGYLLYGSQLGSVHRLLAQHFLGGIPQGMVVNHKDGNKQNNSLDNLEVVTYSQNAKHAFENGLNKGQPGQDNSMAKLTNDQAVKIAEGLKQGKDNETLGNEYGLHPRYVSLIRHGKRWPQLYKQYGPFEKSAKPDPMQDKYNEFLKLKDSMRNKEIAAILEVDASTVSRWRSGQFRNK